MIQLLQKHRNHIAAACIAVLLCAFAAALLHTDAEQAAGLAKAPPGRIYDAGVFGDSIVVHDSSDGVVTTQAANTQSDGEIIPLSIAPKITSDPDKIWDEDAYAGNHTLTEAVQKKDGSIGILTIPKLDLTVNVYESPDNMEAMSKGIAHFPDTSAFNGNVGMSAHNINFDGSDGYFKHLYTLEKGDIIVYQTALGARSYTVESTAAIAASDWSPLYWTDDNRLTMITCISGQPDKRLCVTAVEKAAD